MSDVLSAPEISGHFDPLFKPVSSAFAEGAAAPIGFARKGPSLKGPGLGRPILNEQINFPLTLAPMVGLSHVSFRRLLRTYLPAGAETIWPTEMLNSRRVPKENLAKTPETLRDVSETHLVPQILGNEPLPIAQTVERLEHEWGAQGIDINMGCPVKKALSHNYGVALMGDLHYAAEVVKMTTSKTSLPVSVKLRAGHENDPDYLIRFVRGLEDSGARWVTLHPRTAAQKRRGSADWSQIKWLRDNVSIPVIGNGDVQTADDAIRMLAETECDMVMAGRALTARPWLFWQLGEEWGFGAPAGREGERAPRTSLEEGAEYGRALKQLLGFMSQDFSEELALRKFRFMVRTGSPWLTFGLDLYARSTKAKTIAELRVALDEFFAQDQPMSQVTDLRQ